MARSPEHQPKSAVLFCPLHQGAVESRTLLLFSWRAEDCITALQCSVSTLALLHPQPARIAKRVEWCTGAVGNGLVGVRRDG